MKITHVNSHTPPIGQWALSCLASHPWRPSASAIHMAAANRGGFWLCLLCMRPFLSVELVECDAMQPTTWKTSTWNATAHLSPRHRDAFCNWSFQPFRLVSARGRVRPPACLAYSIRLGIARHNRSTRIMQLWNPSARRSKDPNSDSKLPISPHAIDPSAQRLHIVPAMPTYFLLCTRQGARHARRRTAAGQLGFLHAVRLEHAGIVAGFF